MWRVFEIPIPHKFWEFLLSQEEWRREPLWYSRKRRRIWTKSRRRIGIAVEIVDVTSQRVRGSNLYVSFFLVRRRNVLSILYFFFSQKKSDWTMKNKKRVSHPTKTQSLLDFPTLEESKLISPLVKKMSRNDWRQRMCIFLFRIHLTSLQYKAKIHTTKPQRPRQRCVNRKD